ncbi:LAFE_0C02630g1_1 [Lachancea fermentati]|uniref:Protein ROT1 n=1 Tax=Lachancea fermentati TaxID=4955 RepID=A0A1G4M966_LACFM|nr:LAFE_0C02630g1_1 [Lachancea fermentati]
MVSLVSFLTVSLSIIGSVLADDSVDSLYGTWTSKSNQVFTGPGFYDPIDELLIEPSLPGISYSFTEDGWYEEATYQVTSNPQQPDCPKAAVIYQHGSYEIMDNGTLILTPISVDGRQLFSDPCNDHGTSSYTRYSQKEVFKSFEVSLNTYHGRYMLLLYQSDGSPMQPLYLAYRPPLMLPTETLNPTATEDATSTSSEASSTGSNEKRSVRSLIRRGLENKYKTNAVKKGSFFDTKFYWWVSAGLVGIGSVAFLVF